MKLNTERFVSGRPEQTTMPEVDHLLQYKIMSHTGRRMLLSSVRPGMRIITMSGTEWEVIQNSAKLKRLELRSGKMSMVQDYSQISYDAKYHVHPPTLWYKIKRLFR